MNRFFSQATGYRTSPVMFWPDFLLATTYQPYRLQYSQHSARIWSSKLRKRRSKKPSVTVINFSWTVWDENFITKDEQIMKNFSLLGKYAVLANYKLLGEYLILLFIDSLPLKTPITWLLYAKTVSAQRSCCRDGW